MSSSLLWTLAAGLVAAVLITLHFLLLVFTPFPHPPTEREKTYTTTPGSSPAKLPSLSDKPTLGLSVVIPAYNETERLPIMLDEAMEHLVAASKLKDAKGGKGAATQRAVRDGVELLVVDDGSTDGTTDTARRLAAEWAGKLASDSKAPKIEIRAVRLETNRGKGGAVQHGVCHSRGRMILFADADGASKFADLDLLLEAMESAQDKDGHGIAIGSRAHLVNTEAVVKRSKLRNLLMHGFHLFLRTLGVRGVRDTQCGFKLFTRETARVLFPPLHLPRWSFDVELLLLASLCTPPIPIREVSIRWQEISGSKIRLGWDSIGMARDLLVLRGNLALGRWTVPKRSTAAKQ